ncbi:PRC-barrel domain-containing protein [Pedobacter sp. AW1-32]|uniref:PRC-barrel domain-containing protein n=1 Tax=Pedobacter sp. AW1-32 TaxID=3383026 RepID=UPI003FEEB6EB
MNTEIIEYINLEELSNSDFVLTDGQANIIGWKVVGVDEIKIGMVRDLLIDPVQNAVRYVIVDLDASVSDIEDKAVLLPIGYVEVSDHSKELIAPISHQEQLTSMPRYIIGEVTRSMENQIRTAIGSPAASRIEESVNEYDESDFYKHHHFDRGNILSGSKQVSPIETPGFGDHRQAEQEKIDTLIDHSKYNNEVRSHADDHSASTSQEFEISTDRGILRIQPHESGMYRVFDQSEKIGVVYSQSEDDRLVWRTMDNISETLVSQIGDQIIHHNNLHSQS